MTDIWRAREYEFSDFSNVRPGDKPVINYAPLMNTAPGITR